MLCNIPARVVSGVVRMLTTTSNLNVGSSHYDALGITPKATQGDIKSAYYKLSKIYHPDKSSDEASAKKFRAITEAYEVLGNIQLKKIYDKGLLGARGTNKIRVEYQPDPEPTDPTLKFYKSRSYSKVVPTMDGRQPIYDFDAWSKNHYGDLFEKSKYDKEFLRKTREKRLDSEHSNKQETFLYVMFALGGLFLFLIAQGTTNYDIDKTGVQQNDKESNMEQNTESEGLKIQ